MKKSRGPSARLLMVCVAVFCLEDKALAYTDPGSGVLLWQMLVATFVGVAFASRRILSWFRSLLKKRHEGDA